MVRRPSLARRIEPAEAEHTAGIATAIRDRSQLEGALVSRLAGGVARGEVLTAGFSVPDDRGRGPDRAPARHRPDHERLRRRPQPLRYLARLGGPRPGRRSPHAQVC